MKTTVEQEDGKFTANAMKLGDGQHMISLHRPGQRMSLLYLANDAELDFVTELLRKHLERTSNESE